MPYLGQRQRLARQLKKNLINTARYCLRSAQRFTAPVVKTIDRSTCYTVPNSFS
jgi:hypothetical protein